MTVEQYRAAWSKLPLPVIVHLVATSVEQIRLSADLLDREDTVDAIELGLHDDIDWEDTRRFVQAATDCTEKRHRNTYVMLS